MPKIDEGQEFSINLLQALRILKRAWEAVKPEIIRKCFKHLSMCDRRTEDGLDELVRFWSALKIRGGVEQGVAILDYLDVDEILTTEDPSLVHDEETVKLMNLETEELNFGQTGETLGLMTAEVMADFMEFEYLLDEEAEVEN